MTAALHRVFVLRGEPQARQLFAFLKSNREPAAAAGKPLAVTVTEAKAKRSAEQNRLLWSVLTEIAENAWVAGRQFSKESWHAEFAGRFIGWEETPSGARVPISTTTLSVAEFSAYIEKVIAAAADELGVEISV